MANPITRWIGGMVRATLADAVTEQRSTGGPTGNAMPVTADVLSSLLGGGPTRSGVPVDEQTALTYGAVYAAVRVLSEAVGTLPLSVYEGDDEIEDRKPLTTHPVYRLLRRSPNPEMTPITFKKVMQCSLCLYGNAYARIMLDGAGRPAELWPMRPDQTAVERVAGQIRYRNLRTGDAFAPEEVFHVPGLSFNGIQGLDPIRLHRESIGIGMAADSFAASFYGNGANMGGIMSYAGQITPETKDAARTEWNRLQAGLGNANRTAFLGGGWSYQPLGIAPDNAQFLQTRKFQVEEIARMFRVPPHMLADLSSDGYATLEQQSLSFLVFSLSPWLESWEQEGNRKLLPGADGVYCKFNERRLQRADLAAKQSYYQAGIANGWLSPNDPIRAAAKAVAGLSADVDEAARDDLAEVVTGSLRRGRVAVDSIRTDILNHFENRP